MNVQVFSFNRGLSHNMYGNHISLDITKKQTKEIKTKSKLFNLVFKVTSFLFDAIYHLPFIFSPMTLRLFSFKDSTRFKVIVYKDHIKLHFPQNAPFIQSIIKESSNPAKLFSSLLQYSNYSVLRICETYEVMISQNLTKKHLIPFNKRVIAFSSFILLSWRYQFNYYLLKNNRVRKLYTDFNNTHGYNYIKIIENTQIVLKYFQKLKKYYLLSSPQNHRMLKTKIISVGLILLLTLAISGFTLILGAESIPVLLILLVFFVSITLFL